MNFLDEKGENIKQAIYNISQIKLLTDMKERLGIVISDLEKNDGKKNKIKNKNVEIY